MPGAQKWREELYCGTNEQKAEIEQGGSGVNVARADKGKCLTCKHGFHGCINEAILPRNFFMVGDLFYATALLTISIGLILYLSSLSLRFISFLLFFR